MPGFDKFLYLGVMAKTVRVGVPARLVGGELSGTKRKPYALGRWFSYEYGYEAMCTETMCLPRAARVRTVALAALL